MKKIVYMILFLITGRFYGDILYIAPRNDLNNNYNSDTSFKKNKFKR